jgi:Domain of unknown function (DUF222)
MDGRGASFWAVPGVGVPPEALEPEPVELVEVPVGVADWTVEQAWAALPVVFGLVADTPWWRYAEADLRDRIRLLGRAENQVVAAQVAAVGEALTRGVLVGTGYRSGGAWLRGLVALTPQAASQRVHLAEELTREDLAPTKAGFSTGEVGVGQAVAVTRTLCALDSVPDVDATTWSEAQVLLLSEARRLDARQLGQLGVHLRHRLDPDAADRLAKDEEAQQAARGATLIQEGSGMWWLTAVGLPVPGPDPPGHRAPGPALHRPRLLRPAALVPRPPPDPVRAPRPARRPHRRGQRHVAVRPAPPPGPRGRLDRPSRGWARPLDPTPTRRTTQ